MSPFFISILLRGNGGGGAACNLQQIEKVDERVIRNIVELKNVTYKRQLFLHSVREVGMKLADEYKKVNQYGWRIMNYGTKLQIHFLRKNKIRGGPGGHRMDLQKMKLIIY